MEQSADDTHILLIFFIWNFLLIPAGYEILEWQFLFSCFRRIFPHCLLVSKLSDKKSAAFKALPFGVVFFSCFLYLCFSAVWLWYLCMWLLWISPFGVCFISWTCKFGKFLSVENFTLIWSTPLSPLPGIADKHILELLMNACDFVHFTYFSSVCFAPRLDNSYEIPSDSLTLFSLPSLFCSGAHFYLVHFYSCHFSAEIFYIFIHVKCVFLWLMEHNQNGCLYLAARAAITNHQTGQLKQQKFISDSAGSWVIQDQRISKFVIWCGSPSSFVDSCLLAVSPSHGPLLWGH